MAVCLINPPSPFLLDERVFMPLGILKVAAVLEAAGVGVEVLDLAGYRNFETAVADHASRSATAQFGITATTPQFPAAVKIARLIRELRPDAKIILGGPHATLVAAARKKEQKRGKPGRAERAFAQVMAEFDTVVAGDGEAAIFEAIEPARAGLIDADGRASPLFLDDRRLEETPFPARHLIDVESYRYSIDGVPALSLIAQLGCPFGCGFCAGRSSPMLRHIRTRSSESIVREMLDLNLRWGTRGFMFYDDELNVNKGLVDLMQKIAAVQDTEWRLRGFVKAELFTDEQAEAMYRAGFRWLLVGFESGSPRILENIRKRASREDNTRCIEIAHHHGLKVKALMSLGHPGETRETARHTYEWLKETRPDDFDVTIITPYPGSPYYDDAEPCEEGFVYQVANGDRLYQRELDYAAEADYYKGAPGDYVSHVWTDYLSAKDLVFLRDDIERMLREELSIPFNPGAAAMSYEHSMGQTALPKSLLMRAVDG